MLSVKSRLRKLSILILLLAPLVALAVNLTVDDMQKRGIKPLKTAAIKQLIVGKLIVIRNLDTGGYYEVRFNKDGTRVLQGVAATKVGGGIEYRPFTKDPKVHTAKYEIKAGKLLTMFDDTRFEVKIFKDANIYYAAHSNDNGEIKWELVRK